MKFLGFGGRIFIDKIIILELLVVSIAIFVIGWFLNKDDPLFLKSEYQIINLLAVVLSLYYGFSGGLTFVLILSFAYLLFYKPFPYIQLLQNLLFVRLCPKILLIANTTLYPTLSIALSTLSLHLKHYLSSYVLPLPAIYIFPKPSLKH